MDTTYFRVGDQVVLEQAASACVLTENMQAALKKGPLTVTEVILVPPPQCNCYADTYGTGPHTSGCPKSAGPWGFIGHPQWVHVADCDGNVVQSPISLNEPSRFSGSWFVKFDPVAMAS